MSGGDFCCILSDAAVAMVVGDHPGPWMACTISRTGDLVGRTRRTRTGADMTLAIMTGGREVVWFGGVDVGAPPDMYPLRTFLIGDWTDSQRDWAWRAAALVLAAADEVP